MSNYPIGAENDPAAPWNEDVFFCKECDAHAITDYIDTYIENLSKNQELGTPLSDYEHNDLFDEIYKDLCNDNVVGKCAKCHYDDIADFRDD
jgi:hypothetical protein